MRIRVPLLVLTLCATGPVAAAPCDGMADLLAFIAAEAGYPEPTRCPSVARSDQLGTVPALRSQVGAFVPATGMILLAPDLDTDTVVGRSYLLHELVHAAQYQAGVAARVTCEAELEAEAYRVQTVWLRRQGEFREAVLLDWAAGTLGSCSGSLDLGY